MINCFQSLSMVPASSREYDKSHVTFHAFYSCLSLLSNVRLVTINKNEYKLIRDLFIFLEL